MFVSEPKEYLAIKATEKKMAEKIIKLRQVIRNSVDPVEVAKTLHECELEERTADRFEYAIEWEILGADKVNFWRQVKSAYETIV